MTTPDALEALRPCPFCGKDHTLKLVTAQELAEQEGNDPHELLWHGNPPEPWGEVWCRYERQAKELVAALTAQPAATPDALGASASPTALSAPALRASASIAGADDNLRNPPS